MFERPCLPHSDCLHELAWPQWDSVAAGNPQFHDASRVVRWFALKGLCGPHKLFETFVFFSIIHSQFEAIFSQDVAKEGR